MLIGDGPKAYVKLLNALVAQLGLTDAVQFCGWLDGTAKHRRMSEATALLMASAREGWGLVVTEAAASGTVSIGYDVPGLRDSIGASGGVLTRADPVSLATGLVGLLSSVAGGFGPRARPAGVVPWAEVAAAILAVAQGARSPVMGPADRMTDRDRACRSDAVDCVPQAPVAVSRYVLRQRAPSDFQEEALER